jgi:hypothetical protein
MCMFHRGHVQPSVDAAELFSRSSRADVPDPCTRWPLITCLVKKGHRGSSHAQCHFSQMHICSPAMSLLRSMTCNWPLLQVDGPGNIRQSLKLHQGPLMQQIPAHAGSWKSCHFVEKGHWAGAKARCLVWQYVSSICAKVELSAAKDKWQLSAAHGGIGCNLAQQYNPTTYGRLPVANWRSPEPPRITSDKVHKSGCIANAVADEPLQIQSVGSQGGGRAQCVSPPSNDVHSDMVLSALNVFCAREL